MRSSRFLRFLHILAIVLASGTLTGVLSFLDNEMNSRQQTLFGLQIARQVVSQVETLSLFGKEKQEEDSLSWAVRTLSLGKDPRPIQVTLIQTKVLKKDPENFKYSSQSSALHYSKIISPESGTGISIQVQLAYLGFLGSKTKWMSDALMIITFAIILCLLWWLTLSESSPTTRSPENGIDMYQWVYESKSNLVQLGFNIKRLLQEATTIATAASKERTSNSQQILRAGQEMNKQITLTTENLMYQARLLQKLKEKHLQESDKQQ